MFAYFMGSIVIVCLGIQYIILTRLEKLQADFNSLPTSDVKDADLTSKIESILQSRRTNVAFTAYLSKPATQLSNAQIIPFDKVEINEGKGFNPNTHIFTCPVTGIYTFQTGVLCTHKSTVLTEIVKEGNQLIQAHAEPLANHNQGFNSVITKCEKSENVWVRIDRYGNAVHSERYTTFSGFLLWESK